MRRIATLKPRLLLRLQPHPHPPTHTRTAPVSAWTHRAEAHQGVIDAASALLALHPATPIGPHPWRLAVPFPCAMERVRGLLATATRKHSNKASQSFTQRKVKRERSKNSLTSASARRLISKPAGSPPPPPAGFHVCVRVCVCVSRSHRIFFRWGWIWGVFFGGWRGTTSTHSCTYAHARACTRQRQDGSAHCTNG